MESGSQQTQDLINATRETAGASQSVAEQNRELVAHAGEQAKALTTQAAASQTQANASVAQAEAAKQSVAAARSAADATRRSVEVAQEALRLGHRPSVGAVTITMAEFTPGKVGRVTIQYQNTGTTPALNASAMTTVNIRFVDYPDPKPSALITGIPSRATIAINARRFANGYTLKPLSLEIIDAIKQGKRWFFVYSSLTYEDGRGGKFFTHYCGRYNPDLGSFDECTIYNDSN